MAPNVKPERIITLTTDFGYEDGYVGVVKGVILKICSLARIVDLSHEIQPWNISAASWILANSFSYFPEGTVHVAVVDPSVGSRRRFLLLDAGGHYFIGPDNGIFSGVLSMVTDEIRAFELTEKSYWLPEVSTSFHARDVFAPVAAHFIAGVSADKFGNEVSADSLSHLPAREPKLKQDRLEGSVVYVDRFGNLITNIKRDFVRTASLCQVGKRSIGRIGQTYASAEQGAPVAFVGSHGYLEIAVTQGRANEKLDAGVNTPVILFQSTPAPLKPE